MRNVATGTLICIALALAMVISILPTGEPYVISSTDPRSSYITENIDQGQMTLFHQRYDQGIPTNVFLADPHSANATIANLTYDSTESALHFRTDSSQWGSELYIGGLVPMGEASYTIRLGMRNDNKNSYTTINVGNTKVNYFISSDGDRSLSVLFHDPDGKAESVKKSFGPADDNIIELTVRTDMVARSVSVTCGSETFANVPLYSQQYAALPYDSATNPYLYIENYVSSAGSYVSTYLYEVTQTTDRKLITATGTTNSVPFGLDYPSEISMIRNGTAYLMSKGGTGTVWLDPGVAAWVSSAQDREFVDDLIHNHSWEVGIHYSKQLTSLDYGDAIALMRTEYDQVVSAFGVAPKSWCSLTNADNLTLASWAYENLGMIWRNLGISEITNVGNLHDATWDSWWDQASNGGFVYEAFTHRTDLDPAIRYSISYSNFVEWVDNYADNGMTVVPYAQWFHTNANSFQSEFTGIVATPGLIRFTAHTNGYDALVNVNVSADRYPQITDIDTGRSIEFTVEGDGSLAFHVSDGHTYVMGASSNPLFVTYPRTALYNTEEFNYSPMCSVDAEFELMEGPSWLIWNESSGTLYSNGTELGSFPVSLRAVNGTDVSYQNFTLTIVPPPKEGSDLSAWYVIVPAALAGVGLLAGVAIMRRRR